LIWYGVYYEKSFLDFEFMQNIENQLFIKYKISEIYMSKQQFLVEFDIPAEPDQRFFDLIPEQREQINKMMMGNKIVSYSLNADRTRLWCIFNADSEYEVMEIMNEFPLIDYMTPNIHPLMFHNATVATMPAFSKN
jgi:muconolactone delta-isomerase